MLLSVVLWHRSSFSLWCLVSEGRSFVSTNNVWKYTVSKTLNSVLFFTNFHTFLIKWFYHFFEVGWFFSNRTISPANLRWFNFTPSMLRPKPFQSKLWQILYIAAENNFGDEGYSCLKSLFCLISQNAQHLFLTDFKIGGGPQFINLSLRQIICLVHSKRD